jgi:hypothetical protein
MTQHHNTSKAAGFTLVELSLAMAFIAVLLLAIALLTTQIGSIYNKGLTLRAVNQAGQLLSVQAVSTAGDSTGGRLCAGTTVYAWNYGKTIVNNDPNAFNKFGNSFGPGPAVPQPRVIRLVKFLSQGQDYCQKVAGSYPYIPQSANDLLTGGDVSLAVHTFTINADGAGVVGQPVTGDTKGEQRLYVVSITIGSSEQAVINGNGNTTSCQQSPSRIDDEYCAVNQFTFTARAGHKQG